MKTKHFVGLVVLLLAVSAAFAASAQSNGHGKVRVIAHTDKEVSGALEKGCEMVRDAKTLKALICPEDAASSLGLQEDVKVFAVDSVANTKIRADLVQSSGYDGTGRKVVILDTGYNYYHPELISSYLGGYDFVNKDSDPMDDNGHGSHVAGIITADGIDPSAIGVAPGTGIISGKVLDASGSGYFSDVVTAIYWAVNGPDGVYGNADDFNADAISLSLGTSPPYTYKGYCDTVLPDLTNAIKYALDHGVIVVVAAGNSGTSGVSIPGCISYSTTVGAVDGSDKVASFSGRGNAVDITAPGVGIYSSVGVGGYSEYESWSGTSMATPMVSGTIALIKSAHPGYTVSQVQNALFKTAKDLGTTGFDTSYGWGRVDAFAAVSYSYAPTLSLSANPSTITTAQTSTVTASTSDGKSGVLISFSIDPGLGSLSDSSCTTDSTGKCPVTFNPSSTGTATITASASGYTSASATVTVTPVTYSATFSQSGIPSGKTWGVTVGGTRHTSTTSSLSVSGLSGTVDYSYDPTVSGATGTQYVCSTGCLGSVTSTDNIKAATYKTQYQLTMRASPSGSGTTSPAIGSSWIDSGSVVKISATANTGNKFSSWSGSGTGSYTGKINQATITMKSSITQTANFVASSRQRS